MGQILQADLQMRQGPGRDKALVHIGFKGQLLHVDVMAEADKAFAATGYRRGTIPPFGSTTAWPVIADEVIVGRQISLGAGAHGTAVILAADDVITALGATVADVTDPEE